MGKIFVFIGPSCSGKDTIFKLITMKDKNIIPLVLYTTRPRREKEINGITYNFISADELKIMENNDEIIERRDYNTVHGIWTYATSNKNIDLENNSYATINSIDGYMKLRNYYGNKVIPLFIYSSDDIRLERALKRERKQKEPKYAEMCRRFLADTEDFSKDKLVDVVIYDVYKNDADIDMVVSMITSKIYDEINEDKEKTRKL